MKRALIAAGSLLFALSLGGTAVAAPPTDGGKNACISATDWATVVRDKSSGVSIHVFANIQGIEAEQVVARVNAEPPKTEMTADHVLVLGAKSLENDAPATYVLVAFFNEGCLVASGRADPEGVQELIGGESV